MFPDYKGQAIREFSYPKGFVCRLWDAIPDCEIMPIINGLSESDADQCADQACKLGFRPLVSTGSVGKGLYAALYDGYREAIEIADGAIVRLDTAEHPPEYIPQLLKALETADMVVGDLTFTKETLRPGSPDEKAHLVTFPKLYGDATGDKLPLTCAHGFQGFRNKQVLKQIFMCATRHMNELMETAGPVSWGMDGAMALAAFQEGFLVAISPVPAEKLRDRDKKKIEEQTRCAELLVKAFDH